MIILTYVIGLIHIKFYGSVAGIWQDTGKIVSRQYPDGYCNGAIGNNRADAVWVGLRLLYFPNVYTWCTVHKSAEDYAFVSGAWGVYVREVERTWSSSDCVCSIVPYCSTVVSIGVLSGYFFHRRWSKKNMVWMWPYYLTEKKIIQKHILCFTKTDTNRCKLILIRLMHTLKKTKTEVKFVYVFAV